MVIFGHSYPLTGHGPVPGLLQNGVQALGVKIFFVISGYLIAHSWRSDPSPWRYWLKRSLRIMPGLIGVCLFSVFVLGPAVTQLSLAEYLRNDRTAAYFWNAAFYPTYDLPGVFATNIYPLAVNGSLWSLPVEVAMYVCVPLLVGRRRSEPLTVSAAAFIVLAGSIWFLRVAPLSTHLVVWGNDLIFALDPAYYFLAGTLIAVMRLDRFCNVYIAGAVFAVSAWTFRGAIDSELALALTLPWLTISLGRLSLPSLRGLASHDYSYGLYLYGFPVQQAVVHFFGAQSPQFNFAASLPIALTLGALSWTLIERPALKFKPAQRGAMR